MSVRIAVLRPVLLVLGTAALLAACSPVTPTATAASGTAAPAIASDVDGRYTLTLQLPKDTFTTGEDIKGQATLGIEPGPDAVVSGSGGILGFSFTSVDGTRQIGPAFTADCAIHPVTPASPVTSRLTKSGGWSDDQPDAEFYRQFFNRPGISLPTGEWDIAVETQFYDGPGCSGAPHDLEATVRIHVVDGPAPSP